MASSFTAGKDTDKAVIFASVAILGKGEYLRTLFSSKVSVRIDCHARTDDGILTKSNHQIKIMIGKIKKAIINYTEDIELNTKINDIEQYLSEVKEAVGNDRYRIERNTRRQDNIHLFLDYIIDEAKAKEIILSLTPMDFSEILQNEHKGYEHEQLYVFGKDVTLLERSGTREKMVSLYIKFNKLENCFVIVVSFHEQKYPLKFCFR